MMVSVIAPKKSLSCLYFDKVVNPAVHKIVKSVEKKTLVIDIQGSSFLFSYPLTYLAYNRKTLGPETK